MKYTIIAVATAAVIAGSASASAAWDVIGVKEVLDRTDRDTVHVEGRKMYDRVKVCVYRAPVHFYDMDINFRNGGHQDVSIRARINARGCTRVIDLEGGQRDISTINFVYEETSFKKRRATVKVFAQ
jgi:hypothetical protein